MSNEVTLAQLAAELAQLRQQIDSLNQRLDMIYGAVTRLADSQKPAGTPPPAEKTTAASTPAGGMSLSPEAMMDPGSMLDSLRQYAVNMGLDVSQDTVERLKSHPPADEETDDQQ
jgi:hypothetical protein